jgi:hypothetical protein
MLLAMRRGHQDRNVLSNQLRGIIAEHPLHRGVGGFDDPTVVDRDDRVHRGVQNGLRTGQALAQRAVIDSHGVTRFQ